MFERVLLALDGSPASMRAKDVAAGLAASNGSEVLVFHVREVDFARSAEPPGVLTPSRCRAGRRRRPVG